MIQDTQQQADRIFSEAVDLPIEQRDVFLDESCGEDEDLRAEVDLLLSQYGSTEKALSSTDPSHTLSAGEPEAGGIAVPGAGDLLGNFRLLERLDQGESDCFMAEAEGSRERVLLEVLGPELDNNDVRRIRIEAETITRLEHPGLHGLLEVGTAILGTGPRAFIVTAATEQQGLSTWVEERSPTVHSRIKLATRLVEAVAFGHARGILDGDLHPGRVMVDDMGRPMIRAMGLPRILRHYTDAVPEGPSCRAPELVETPWSRIDAQADIYALGGMMEWLFQNNLGGDDSVTREMRRIIGRAHAHDTEARYTSADALLGDLRRIELGPEESDSNQLVDDVREFARRHPRTAIATVGLATFAVAALITMLVMLA